MSEGGFFGEVIAWKCSLALVALMLLAWNVGWRVGLRQRSSDGEPRGEKFSDASLTVLGLLLAFTFAMSLQKHDARRSMVVAESNAIGDFYTCATLLPEPARGNLQDVIRQYTELHLHIVREGWNGADLNRALAQLNDQTNVMTATVRAAVDAGTPVAVPLTNTLNEVTSAKASRIFAVEDRLPTSVVLLLFLSALISMFLNGVRHGALGRSQWLGMVSLVFMFGMVTYVILDLNQPARGLIEVSQAPMQRLLQTMQK